jgi:hypothetical protein
MCASLPDATLSSAPIYDFALANEGRMRGCEMRIYGTVLFMLLGRPQGVCIPHIYESGNKI